ncbi:unnamed protein product [Effrenium voratum]|nr:unnamed protein product [Effrenium voratum]
MTYTARLLKNTQNAYLPDLSALFNRFSISAEFYATQWPETGAKLPMWRWKLTLALLGQVAFLGGREWRTARTTRRAHAELLHHGSKLLAGKDKWLGGVIAPDGGIYCIPCNKDCVLRICAETGDIATLGRTSPGEFKWSRGVLAKNGHIYGIPAAAESVLKISTGDLCEIGTVPEGRWKWHGAALAEDGIIYCIPANADRVLRIDPESDHVEEIGPRLPGRWKWYGGIRGRDGAIYGIPYSADSVLKIQPETGEVSTLGSLKGRWKWHGGALGVDGAIYGIPAHAERVLKIVPETGEVTLIGDPIPGKYKWLGAVLGQDGCLYGIPYNAQKILKIPPGGEEVTLVDIPLKGANMWQGGVLGHDGAIYFIPRRAERVLRLADDGTVSVVSGDAMFIHRVGLALLKEARPSLLGQSFDTTIDRLRCLCQTQLSPEALVASALQFKVTNRFLSELEAAITSPAGLPCCFLERDLDRGKTCCRFLLNPDDGTNKAPDVFGSTFLEGSLPAPRVPADPLAASRLPEPKAKSKALGTTSQLKSLARKSQKVLSRASLGIRTGRSTGSKADADADLSMPLPDPVLQEKPWPARSASVPLSRGSRGEKGAWDEVQPVSPDRARSRNWMPSLRRRKASPDRRAELFGS